MTRLEGLAGGRNAGSAAPSHTVTADSKYGRGSDSSCRDSEFGAFSEILSGLAGSEAAAVPAKDSHAAPHAAVPAHEPAELDASGRGTPADPKHSGTAFLDRLTAHGRGSHGVHLEFPPRTPSEESVALRDVGARRKSGPRSDESNSGEGLHDSRQASSDLLSSRNEISVSTAASSASSNAGLPLLALVSYGADPAVETAAPPRRVGTGAAFAPSEPLDPIPMPSGIRHSRHASPEDGKGILSFASPTIGDSPASGALFATAEPVDAFSVRREPRSSLGALAPEKVTVLAAETHLPPVAVPSAVDQIVRHIVTDLGPLVPRAEPKPLALLAGDALEPRAATAACVRCLTLLLEPASLGPVTVKLRLSGATLGLEIEADEAETTSLIGRGREGLTEKLRALGLSVDAFVVVDRDRSRR